MFRKTRLDIAELLMKLGVVLGLVSFVALPFSPGTFLIAGGAALVVLLASLAFLFNSGGKDAEH